MKEVHGKGSELLATDTQAAKLIMKVESYIPIEAFLIVSL